MLQIPSGLQTHFESLLREKAIAEPYWPHRKKWLRYYLDFCSKCRHPAPDRESLSVGFFILITDVTPCRHTGESRYPERVDITGFRLTPE